MRIVVIFMGLLFVCTSLVAQVPFKGGAGDGYAMVELNSSTIKTLPEIVDFEVFPNPLQQHTASQFFVKGDFVDATISLTDTKGRLILERNSLLSGGSIEIMRIPPGIYFLKVQAEGKQATRKLMISPK